MFGVNYYSVLWINMIESITSGLNKDKFGIYHASGKSKISYPEDQNSLCMQFEESSFWFIHRNNSIISMVKNSPPTGPILDVGGGNGFVSLGLIQSGFEAIVLEPGIEGAMNAKKRGITGVICSTYQDAGLRETSLDACAMFDVIEHIEDDTAFLKALHQDMKINGKLYLPVPAYSLLWSQVDKDAGHYRRYTRRTMTKLLKNCGFNVNYSTYIFSVLPIPIFLFRTIPSLFGSKKNHSEIASTKKSEHTRKSSILSTIWSFELSKLSAGSKIPFGGTLLVTATKV
jgi:hypothetical protein